MTAQLWLLFCLSTCSECLFGMVVYSLVAVLSLIGHREAKSDFVQCSPVMYSVPKATLMLYIDNHS